MTESMKDSATLNDFAKRLADKNWIANANLLENGKWPQKLRAAGISEWVIDRIYDRYGALVNTEKFQWFINRLAVDDQKYGIGKLSFFRSKASSDHDISTLCTELGFPIETNLERQARFTETQSKIGIKGIGQALIGAAVAVVTPPVILAGTVGGSAIIFYHWLFNK